MKLPQIGALLALSLLCLSSQARPQEPLFPNLQEIKTSEFNAEYEQSFLKASRASAYIFDLLAIKTSAAKSIVILPSREVENADPVYFVETQILFIGDLADCQSPEDIDTLGVSLHELAHSVFTPNFYKAFGLSGEAPIEFRYDAEKAFNGHRDTERAKRVTLRELSAPFDEVFADTFAVLALKNPKTISKALTTCKPQTETARDFSQNYSVKNWDGGSLKPTYLPLSNGNPYDRSNPGGGALYIDAKIHDVLSPFRTQVWNSYLELKKKRIQNSEPLILKAVFEASVSVIRELWAEGIQYGPWFEISKPELNARVIREFKKQVSKQDPPSSRSAPGRSFDRSN